MVGIIKITERTKTVLAGFGRINPSILVRPGSTLRTINPGTARVVAKAVVDQVFDRTFGIYQIPQFLKALARFPDPVLVFDDEVVAIRDGSGVADVIRIPLAQPGKITTPSDQEPRFEVDTTFNLSGAELAWTLKAAQVLSNKHIVITGDEGKVVLWAMDARDPEKHHRTKSVIGNTDRDFRVVLLAANAEKLIPGDYRVEIGYRGNASVIEGIARFSAADAGLVYWMPAEAGSEPASPELRAAMAEQQRRAAEAAAMTIAEKKAERAALREATAKARRELKAAVAKLPSDLRGRIGKVSHRLAAFRTRTKSTITITDYDTATVEQIRTALVAGGIAPDFAQAICFTRN
jgi:hypothetical protein